MEQIERPLPIESLRNLQCELGRLLEPLQVWWSGSPFPAIDLVDAGDRYVLNADLLGLSADELNLTITRVSLTLRGDRPGPHGINDKSYLLQERPCGPLSRTVTLPEPIDSDRVSAMLSNGVLTATLPKVERTERTQSRHIPISTLTA